MTQHDAPKYGFSKTDNNRKKSDIWYTPLDIVNKLGVFDLDPCGSVLHKTAKVIYEDNGLEKHWFGKVWLNPPYSEVSNWLDRLFDYGNGIALVFGRTDTKWAQRHMNKADSVFFLKGRIKFLDKDFKTSPHCAGHGSMFLSYGFTPDYNMEGWQAK